MIKLSAYQGRCTDDIEVNVAKVRGVITKAAEGGSDFLCFPEGYLSNYKAQLAIGLDDGRILELMRYTAQYDMAVIVGLSECVRGDVFNTALVLHQGRLLGTYRKTMLTTSDKKAFTPDYSLPVFEAKGIPFGVIICHDSSFVEPALTLRWKGARLLFSPHYNRIPYERADEHRTLVRNNHVGLSALLQMVVVRSNVVGRDESSLSYGDTTIFSPLGVPVAAAPLFKEAIISAEFEDSAFSAESWRARKEVPLEVCQQLWDAARESIARRRTERDNGGLAWITAHQPDASGFRRVEGTASREC
jgi:predicted amidohydrolase